jgi:hypothetical protein
VRKRLIDADAAPGDRQRLVVRRVYPKGDAGGAADYEPRSDR